VVGLMVFAIAIPLINGCVVAIISNLITDVIGNVYICNSCGKKRFLYCSSGCNENSRSKANPGFVFLPMAIGTFLLISTLGMPIYYSIILYFELKF
jgi:hypothetical protein